jgi:DMSO reductase family type II enzyme chaperone
MSTIVATAFAESPEPASRSALYALLAQAFRYPTRAWLAGARAGTYQSELRQCLAGVPHLAAIATGAGVAAEAALALPATTVYEDFEVRFVSTFDAGTGEPPCPAYEGVYREGLERTALMLRVASFYQHFGLKMSTAEGRREAPDHLSTELELMHFLTFKEGQARLEGNRDLLAGYLRAQRDFLQQQLSQWLPAFVARLESACPVPFYVAMGRLVAHVVELEQDFVASALKAETAGSAA